MATSPFIASWLLQDDVVHSNSSVSPQNPGEGVVGGYQGMSFTVKALIVFFSGVSMYNALELLTLIFFTFTRFRGLYFHSLMIASVSVILYALGFLFKLLNITTGNAKWLAITFITIGWYGMVTGQSVVLWSRLHLLVDSGDAGRRTLRWTLCMIIVDAIILHIPTTVLTFGSNGNISTASFVSAYNVMEKIQMCGFFIQECILSTLYILQAARLMKNSMRPDARKFFIQLLGINIVIIIMDIGLLASEAASLYLYETIIKGTIYSIKLKLEFAILGKLVNFVGGRPESHTANEERLRQASAAYADSQRGGDGASSKSNINGEIKGGATTFDSHGPMDLSDFVDLSKIQTDTSHAPLRSPISMTSTMGNSIGGKSAGRRNTIRTGRGVTDDDVDLARFEHTDDSYLPDNEKFHSDEESVEPFEHS